MFYSLLGRGDQEPAEVLHQSSMRKNAQIVGFLQLSLIQLTRPETPDTSTSHDTVAFSFFFHLFYFSPPEHKILCEDSKKLTGGLSMLWL